MPGAESYSVYFDLSISGGLFFSFRRARRIANWMIFRAANRKNGSLARSASSSNQSTMVSMFEEHQSHPKRFISLARFAHAQPGAGRRPILLRRPRNSVPGPPWRRDPVRS